MRPRRSSASPSTYLRSRPDADAPVFSWFWLGIMRKLSYKEKFIQMDREAAATAICALIIMAAFWAALLPLKGYFRDFDLDQDAPEATETTKGDAA